jgi:hypothetical protein
MSVQFLARRQPDDEDFVGRADQLGQVPNARIWGCLSSRLSYHIDPKIENLDEFYQG